MIFTVTNGYLPLDGRCHRVHSFDGHWVGAICASTNEGQEQLCLRWPSGHLKPAPRDGLDTTLTAVETDLTMYVETELTMYAET